MKKKEENLKCHICYEKLVKEFELYHNLYRVTSDCRPWKKNGRIGICKNCNNIQKIIDDSFFKEVNEIYNSYAVYFQADGEEQRVFDQKQGISNSRSEFILNNTLKKIGIKKQGSILDIGCSNGGLLKSFNKLYPEWLLFGSELNDKYKKEVEKINNFKKYFTCELSEITGKYDIITMIHTLEHIIDPYKFVKLIRDRLNEKALLLIEVPNFIENPFDLTIADHCTHYTLDSLKNLIKNSGFEIILASDKIIPKEITILAVKNNDIKIKKKRDNCNVTKYLTRNLSWLIEIVKKSSLIKSNKKFGIFGTSIAASWLYKSLDENVDFFVDEDKSRINKTFLNKKIYSPSNIPDSSDIFIALPYKIAYKIKKRLGNSNSKYHLPPKL